MSWNQELDNAKSIFKTGTTKQKLEFIWDYYKLPILGILLVLFLLGQVAISYTNTKEYVLQGVFLNSMAEAEDIQIMENGFLTKYPIDPSEETVYFDTSLYYNSAVNGENAASYYESMQVLMARMTAGDIDFLIADTATMNELAYNQVFYDLSDVLSSELVQKYEPNFMYCDGAVIEAMNSIDYLDISASEIVFPNPSSSHLMENPIPVMIDLTGSDKLSAFFPFSNHSYAIAFVVNGHNLDKALDFLAYLSD